MGTNEDLKRAESELWNAGMHLTVKAAAHQTSKKTYDANPSAENGDAVHATRRELDLANVRHEGATTRRAEAAALHEAAESERARASIAARVAENAKTRGRVEESKRQLATALRATIEMAWEIHRAGSEYCSESVGIAAARRELGESAIPSWLDVHGETIGVCEAVFGQGRGFDVARALREACENRQR